ncbi:site-specific recombinase [human gut metagenome]|uniref:Site-specific recombinase n=1 Tax=human gut metagenome TaxID=408170 RepID=K1UDV6_9ZZZZ
MLQEQQNRMYIIVELFQMALIRHVQDTKLIRRIVNKAVFAQISNHMRCCIDALSVIRELNSRSSGLKKYDVYEKAITRQRRELEKVNRKFSELYGDYSEHLINESEYLTLKQQYLLKSEALKKEIDNLLVSQNLYSKEL